MRIGMGYDVHAFAADRALVLGGIDIPHDRGLLGHSDADVLTHALMDAILGAMRAGDIGAHFPDTDPAYAGASSVALLESVVRLMREEGFTFVDADITLALEHPKMSGYRDMIRQELANRIGVAIDCIGLKATTTEGLGFVGRQEGVAAWAVVLLEQD